MVSTISEASRSDTIEIHPQDIAEDAGFFIQNDAIGSLRIYGSLRLSGAYDLNGLTNANNFSTYEIPVGDEAITQPRFFMSPNQTRLGLEVLRAETLGLIKIKIETDFLGENNGIRIRHAYVESGNFLVGQTWSSFTDVNSIPFTVDADGPNSSVKLRTVRLRYSNHILEEKIRYVLSLESPSPDISLGDSLSDRLPSQFLPDIAGLLRHDYDNGYLVLSGIVRAITVKDTSSSSEQVLGLGVLFAGTFDIDDENKFLFQGVHGRAIARFITALNGKGLDLVYNPATRGFEASRESGFLVSLMHRWREGVSSTATAGYVVLHNRDYEPPDVFNYSYYISGNLFWNSLSGIRLGLEFSHGRRINKGGDSGRANRIGFIFYTDF